MRPGNFTIHVNFIFPFLFFLFSIPVLSQTARLVLPVGHHGDITGMHLSQDGKYLLTSGETSYLDADQTTRIWQVNTGELLHTFYRDQNNILGITDDFRLMFTTGKQSAGILKWDIKTEKVIDTLKIKYNYEKICFSGNGELIALLQNDSITILRSIKSLLVRSWPGFDKETEIVFSPDSKYLVALSASQQKLMVIETVDFKTIFEKNFETGGETDQLGRNIVFSNDGNFFCTFGHAIYTWIFDIPGKSSRPLTAESYSDGQTTRYTKHSVEKACFSFNNEFLITSGKGEDIWNVKTGEWKHGIILPKEDNSEGEEDIVMDVIFSPVTNDYFLLLDKGSIVKSSAGNVTTSGKKVLEVPYSTSGVLKLTKDARYLIAAVNNKISLINSNDISLEFRFKQSNEILQTIALQDETGSLAMAFYPSLITLTNPSNPLESVVVDSSFKYNAHQLVFLEKDILIGYANGEPLKSWKLDNKKVKFQHEIAKTGDQGFLVSPGKKYLLLKDTGFRDSLNLFDPKTFKVVSTLFAGPLKEISALNAAFSPDDKLLVIWNNYYVPTIWGLPEGKLLGGIEMKKEAVQIIFSHDNKKMIVFTRDKWVKSFDIENKFQETDSFFLADEEWGERLAIDTRNEKLYYLSENGEMQERQVTDFNKNRRVSLNKKFYMGSLKTLPGGKYLAWMEKGSMVDLIDVIDLKIKFTVAGRDIIYPDKTDIFYVLNDDLLTAYSKSDFKKRYSLAYIGNENFIITAEGYYSGSKNASGLLHYIDGEKVISFAQLDLKYNRPDLVLEKTGVNDQSLIKAYRKAWEKRMKKLGVDTTRFKSEINIPQADIINRLTIKPEQSDSLLVLKIHAADSLNELTRFNLWVNEVPLFGQNGINIERDGRKIFDTSFAIKLSVDRNRIETSVINKTGFESYRTPLFVKYEPVKKSSSTVYFIGIGIDRFADSAYNLDYSTKDIRDLVVSLRKKFGQSLVVDTVFNSNLTTGHIRKLKEKLKQSGVNDKVIISYSGHGLLSKEFDYYLSTYQTDFSNPQQGGLPYEELENLMDGIAARRKLLLIDACHSGEVDKEDLIALDSVSKSIDLLKGLQPVGYKNENSLGLQNSFELMQNIFVNVGKTTGATVISAAAGTQFALERNDLRNGVFTYTILEAMKNHKSIRVSELKKIVSEHVFQLTNGMQKPTSRAETTLVDWEVW